MSEWRGRLEDSPELESALDWVTENWHAPAVAVLLVFMLWNRVRTASNFDVGGEILFSGNDAWYHYRTVTYTVQNWPATMPFDPWTNFPHGTASGQFGTLYDQMIATAALVVGLGSPTDQQVRMTLLFAPAIFGVAAGIPTYVIGRRLGGRIGGVTAVTVLALSAGSFLARSMVGFSDHHVAEALFMAVGILGTMVAIRVADRDKPIYEQVVERDFQTLRPTVAWSALAGFGISLYLWVWPFGVLLIGLLGTFFLIQLSLEFLRGESPEHTAFAGTVSMGVVAVTMMATISTSGITASDFSLLHPLLAAGVAAGCVFMAWLAREWEDRDLERSLYPASVLGIIVFGVVFVAVVLPDLYGYFANQLTRIFGLGFYYGTGSAGTIGEATPLVLWEQGQTLGEGISTLYDAYGFALFAALGGAVLGVARAAWSDEFSGEHLLAGVWLVFVLALTFTQQRFMYYLVIPVGVLTGYLTNVVIQSILSDFDADDVLDNDVEIFQVITVLTMVLILLTPMVVGQGGLWGQNTAVYAGNGNNPGQGIVGWNDGLDWLDENTPEEGTYNGSDNRMDHYGTYPAVDDHDYQSGQYGVLSWWDYGHWITAAGERIPNANPFQQGAETAAQFLIAQNETQATDVLEASDEDDAKTRYIAVDWKMTSTYSQYLGKFFAPPSFVEGVSSSDFYHPIYSNVQDQQYFMYHTQKYYDSTSVRLYEFHGSAVETQPVVVDWTVQNLQGGGAVRTVPTEGENAQPIKNFDSMAQARAYVANDSTSAIGGIGGNPSERVPAMEHYRLVGASEKSATDSPYYRASQRTEPTTPPRWTKFFERVPGATIEGQGPANSTVTGSVEMKMPNSNETFTYHQRAQTNANGEFTMTVPYSTTGYDEYGPENGHTDVSVRANGSYQFSAFERAENGTVYRWSDSADVSEGQVVGEDSTATTVDMERSVLVDPNQATDGQNQTAGNETTGGQTAGTETGDGQTGGNGTDGGQTATA